MRILHIVESFASGTLAIVTTLAEESAERGHRSRIAYGRRPETPREVRGVVAATVELHPVRGWDARRVSGHAHAARELRREVRGWRPDVVHLHSSFAGAVGAVALRGLAPLVYTPHGYSFTMADRPGIQRTVYRAAELAVARRVTLVGGVSEAEAALARRLGAPRVVAVPSGLRELDAPPPPRPPRQPPVVLAGGRIGPARRPDASARILAAVTDLARVGWLGAAPPGADGAAALEAAGIDVTGWLPRQEMLDRLATASAYLHFSAWDGLPTAVLEAMAHDVPVIASDLPANRELLGPGGVARGEAEAIAGLRRLLLDPAERERRLSEQRSRRERFGAQRMVDDWLEVYAALCSSSPPDAADSGS